MLPVIVKLFEKILRKFMILFHSNLLLIPLVGVLRADDARVLATIEAIERELLLHDTFVLRYETRPELDGLPANEGAFLACSFWLVSIRVMQGRVAEARALFECRTTSAYSPKNTT